MLDWLYFILGLITGGFVVVLIYYLLRKRERPPNYFIEYAEKKASSIESSTFTVVAGGIEIETRCPFCSKGGSMQNLLGVALQYLKRR
jgi:hypothetical protein